MESKMSEENTEMKPEKKKTKKKPARKVAETAAPVVAAAPKRRGRPPGSKNKKRRKVKTAAVTVKFKIASFIRTAKRLETTRAKLVRLEKELKKMVAQAV